MIVDHRKTVASVGCWFDHRAKLRKQTYWNPLMDSNMFVFVMLTIMIKLKKKILRFKILISDYTIDLYSIKRPLQRLTIYYLLILLIEYPDF